MFCFQKLFLVAAQPCSNSYVPRCFLSSLYMHLNLPLIQLYLVLLVGCNGIEKGDGKEMINLKPQRFSEPSMLFFVKDIPNIVSLAGLLCALFGIYFAILDKFSFIIFLSCRTIKEGTFLKQPDFLPSLSFSL